MPYTIKLHSLSAVCRIILFFAVCCACSGNDEPITPEKNSAKSILAFSLESLTPKVTATISEVDKKISIVVPAGTVVTALVPTITLSEKATVSPASGVAQDFSVAVVYTVTAENGSAQTYEITVVVGKSSEKRITAFKFATLTPVVEGVIDESNKKITVTVPNETDIKSLAPTLEISARASVSPASGTVKDFSDSVTYTVTAEDLSTVRYKVKVLVSTVVDFVLDPYAGPRAIRRGESIDISGLGFEKSGVNVSATLINTVTGEKIDLIAIDLMDEFFSLTIPDNVPIGTYQVKINVGKQFQLLDGVIEIKHRMPKLGPLKDEFGAGESFILSGQFFLPSGNVLYLKQGGQLFTVDISRESTISIDATMPVVPPGVYTLGIKIEMEEIDLIPVITILPPIVPPTITSINKATFSRGETIIIGGTNFKRGSTPANITFIPLLGGLNIVRGGMASADGKNLVYKIEANFPTGTYNFSVEVGGDFTEIYPVSITITP